MSSYFYSHAEKDADNAKFLEALELFAESKKQLMYVLDRPLTDQKYSYEYKKSLIVLSPKNKIAIVNYGTNKEQFANHVEDIIEDIASISDKYQYREIIGRPRSWRDSLIELCGIDLDIDVFFMSLFLTDPKEIKRVELLISLFTGSINDMERVKANVPETLLDKVKQKIQLFDGDQTRFIYQNTNNKRVTIQGLSGTGKTELLLHKLKDIYISEPHARIYFTCWNKILADKLRTRIPSFFNFMRVEQQIEWNKRLWCTAAWGAERNQNSGVYSFICEYLNVPFYQFSYQMPFYKACELTLKAVKERYSEGSIKPAFTYIFIDESQDFDENFFQLCELVTEKRVFVAGDIFQSIFDESISRAITPDFLLGKCYRTDPKTLMFAHALGMGLFEDSKLRWLDEKEWHDCGYDVKIDGEKKFHLTREPLRRFEDVEETFESISIVATKRDYTLEVAEVIKDIRKNNTTAGPEDIGIIILDSGNSIYELADRIEYKIQSEIGWKINKAYETKTSTPNTILISNRNNVKGLEFPFVICLTGKITNGRSYRNSLYTMLTRSFIKSYFVIPESGSGLTQGMQDGLKDILSKREMVIIEPSEEEKKEIKTKFNYDLKQLSYYDLMLKIFEKLKIDKKYHEKLKSVIKDLEITDSDEETLIECVKDAYKYIV